MLTAAPALPQTSGGAGTGPGHVWTPLCVHKGHGDRMQSHPYSQPAREQRNPPLQRVTVLLARERRDKAQVL